MLARLEGEVRAAEAAGAGAVALGCAGMAHLRDDLAARVSVPLIDGVRAAALLAAAAVRVTR
ncbi:aspartate/glutamate racemase family protein [Rhodobacter xanthinilyticus]|uniref:aspartate/glutamate racemase family protein n=1 Tax=Rhodobacter xanthinilyticus TaxID=1850250 RepID=UPI002E8E5A0C|nr:aspartate/glutamate racemase family protein [Rhodobacter xanthinilyticus]